MDLLEKTKKGGVRVETIIWQWGPFSIDYYSLLFFTAVLTGLIMVLAEGRRKRLPDQRMLDFTILTVISGIFGSRLSYVLLLDLSYYLQDPVRFFRLQDGRMIFWGGIVFSLIMLSLWAGRKRLTLGRYLDAAAPALTIGLALGFSGTALYGREMLSKYPWGISLGEATYHPDGAYMIVCLIALFLIIWRRRPKSAYEGELFVWFILGYGLIILGVDFFRDSASFVWILTAGQTASLVALFITALFILSGPKSYSASFYMGHNPYEPKFKGAVLQSIFCLLLTVLLLLIYYHLHQPFIMR